VDEAEAGSVVVFGGGGVEGEMGFDDDKVVMVLATAGVGGEQGARVAVLGLCFLDRPMSVLRRRCEVRRWATVGRAMKQLGMGVISACCPIGIDLVVNK
jgi:hypothetical protein